MAQNTNRFTERAFVKNHPEEYFELLRLARVTVDSIEAPTIEEKLAAIGTLNHVPTYAKIHKRIIPLLHAKAKKIGVFDKLSKETQKLLVQQTQQGIVSEIAKKQQLNDIIKKLGEYNIPLILLKGTAFAGVLYSEDAPRTSNDLDILVQKKHWDQAVTLVKELMNYTQKPNPDVFGDLYELSFKPKGNVGAALDLHKSLINPFLFKINEHYLWEHSLGHPSYNNSLVRMLSPEHALIHQALHAYKDMDFGKYNLVDSHELIKLPNMKLETALSFAKDWGVTHSLNILLQNYDFIMCYKTTVKNNLFIHRSIRVNFAQSLLSKLLLKSKHSLPVNNKKTGAYRMTQLLAMFLFSGSIKRPIFLLHQYLKHKLSRKS